MTTPPERRVDSPAIDPLTGEPVVIIRDRQARPNLPAGECPFCVGGLEAPVPYDVRWFVNRWPALPDGRAEVVLYSPDHHASLGSLDIDQAERVVQLWTERTVALARRDDVSYVLVFENRGAEVGATIPHPHGQIYAFDSVPPAPAAELARHGCALCDEAPGDLLVAAVDDWHAWVPATASWPYGMVLAPTAHVGDLAGARATHRALAELLVDVFARLDRLFQAPMPYMFWWHQRPTDGAAWPTAHLHAHVAPLLRRSGVARFVAAGELGSGVFFNPVDPVDAAAHLRQAAGGHH